MNEYEIWKAMEGITHMIHVASPVPSETTKDSRKKMIRSTVHGIQAILLACKLFKVKKLIVTSSDDTIKGGGWKGPKDNVYNEDDFSFEKPNQTVDGYMESKQR